jgi:hypothetical protein
VQLLATVNVTARSSPTLSSDFSGQVFQCNAPMERKVPVPPALSASIALSLEQLLSAGRISTPPAAQ